MDSIIEQNFATKSKFARKQDGSLNSFNANEYILDSVDLTHQDIQSTDFQEPNNYQKRKLHSSQSRARLLSITSPRSKKDIFSNSLNGSKKTIPILLIQTIQNCELSPKCKEQEKLIIPYVEFNAQKNYQNYMFGNLKLREGFVQKLNNYGYQKIYLMLTKERIFEYTNDKKLSLIRVLNFTNFKCELRIEQPNLIILKFFEVGKMVQYKIEDNIDLSQWIKCFKSAFSNASIDTIHIIYSEIERYFNDQIITENQLTQVAETGDILLFETDNMGAQIQRVVTRSKYDHVAIILRVSSKFISVFDSNADTGVSFVEWNTFIDINDLYQKIVIRKLMDVKDRKTLEGNLFMFLNAVHGNKYQMSAGKLLKQKSISPSRSSTKTEDSGFFCSELVAKAFKKCKLLQCNKASSSFWPVDFAQEKQLKLCDGVYLDREITVVMNKHCLKQ